MAEEQGSKDTTLKAAIAEPAVTPAVEPEVSLEGWSTRVEDLIDKDDKEGAVKLLEGVIAKLSLAKNADSNLGMAAAMSDLGRLYGSRGMSLKADKLLSDSLLIRKKAEGAPRVDDDLSWYHLAFLAIFLVFMGSISGHGVMNSRIRNFVEFLCSSYV